MRLTYVALLVTKLCAFEKKNNFYLTESQPEGYCNSDSLLSAHSPPYTSSSWSWSPLCSRYLGLPGTQWDCSADDEKGVARSHGEKPTFQEAQLPTQTLLAGVSSGGPAVHLPSALLALSSLQNNISDEIFTAATAAWVAVAFRLRFCRVKYFFSSNAHNFVTESAT